MKTEIGLLSMASQIQGGHLIIYKGDDDSQKGSTIKADTFVDKVLTFICILYMMIKKLTLSDHFMPYILTIWAVALGILNAL